MLTAVIVSALGAVAVELIRERGKSSGDIALALLFYGGISGGVFLVALSERLEQRQPDVVPVRLAADHQPRGPDRDRGPRRGGAAGRARLRPWLFAVSHDEEYARVSGLPVRALNLILAVITAVTVTVAMRAVGLLLVSALMVVPVAAAQLVTRGFRSTMALAMVFGLLGSVVGLSGVVGDRTRRPARPSCWWRSSASS